MRRSRTQRLTPTVKRRENVLSSLGGGRLMAVQKRRNIWGDPHNYNVSGMTASVSRQRKARAQKSNWQAYRTDDKRDNMLVPTPELARGMRRQRTAFRQSYHRSGHSFRRHRPWWERMWH